MPKKIKKYFFIEPIYVFWNTYFKGLNHYKQYNAVYIYIYLEYCNVLQKAFSFKKLVKQTGEHSKQFTELLLDGGSGIFEHSFRSHIILKIATVLTYKS